jgi:uncharacterized heparinase superfamily protein
MAKKWDRERGTLTLLNQTSFSLKLPVNWQAESVDDPLWSFRLHSWEWAWPVLIEGSAQKVMLTLWRDWVTHVPVGQGLAWQPDPVSRRLAVWCAAWHLLDGGEKLLGAIAQHADYLTDHLERDLDNNHLIVNAKALAWAGLLFPDLRGARRWRTLGLPLLWDALDEQIRSDGGHIENATSYHLAVWRDGLETALLCRASGVHVPESAWETLVRMGEFALALRRPDGQLPLLNDSVSGEPWPVSQLFTLAAKVLNRSDFAWAAGAEDMPVPTVGSQAFRDTGYAVLRSGWGPEDTYLIFDAGDLGPPHCPGHGHADALSIELWGRGDPLILDPGTYQYPAGHWRDYFRGTAAHSTAMVDGHDQSCFAGPFRVAGMAHGRLVSVNLDGATVTVVGEHDGYTRLCDPVMHRRRISLRCPDHLEITDTFSGAARHRVDLRFHLAPCEVELLNEQYVEALYPGGTKLLLKLDGPEGVLGIEEGWISRTWYRKVPSPVLKFCFKAKLPVTVRTFLRID